MTTPTILPVGFAGNSTDYLKAKVSRDGDAFFNPSLVAIPSGTATTTIVGIVPFTSGCRISVQGSVVLSDALGTSVTASLGVVYDDNVGNTNNQTLFASASTAAAAGGVIPITPSSTNIPYITTGNGWVVVTTGGAATTTAGNINSQLIIDYFTGGIQ